MATANEIGRVVHEMAEHSKSILAQNIVKAVSDGKFRSIDTATDLPALLALVNLSVDQSYHQSGRALDKVLARLNSEQTKKNL